MATSYYALTLSMGGPTEAFFCQIDPAPDLQIMQGAFSVFPTENEYTSVSIYPQVAQVQFPPTAQLGGGVTIATDARTIAGNFQVSPALKVTATLTLWGPGGQEVGSVTLEPGQTSTNFSWPVSGGATTAQDAQSMLSKLTAKQ